MSNEDLDNDDDDSDDDDHPDNDQNPENEEDLEVVEFNEEPSTTDQHTDQTFAEAIDQEEDMLDEDQEDHEIPGKIHTSRDFFSHTEKKKMKKNKL